MVTEVAALQPLPAGPGALTFLKEQGPSPQGTQASCAVEAG